MGTPDMRVIYIILLTSFITFIKAADTNEILSQSIRHPRVSGRIVKLYSGTRPEPLLCPGEGFQPDPANCALFYRCVKSASGKFTVYKFQCGPGTVYDPDTEVCNHPQSTKRSECGGSRAPSTEQSHENEINGAQPELPSPISTNKPVYTEKTTPGKDVTTVSTPFPWESTNKAPNTKVPTSTISTPYPWTTASQQSSTLKSTTSGIRQPSSQSGDSCSSDGFMGDSENCRKFYRCVGNQRGGFIRYEFTCSESTIWDDNAQSCNHPWAVQKRRCGRGNSHEYESNNESELNKEASNKTIQQQTQINYGSKVIQIQTQIGNGSVIQNQTQINYGDRINQKPNSNAKQNQSQISPGSAVSQTQTQIDYGNKGFQTQLQVDHIQNSSQAQTQVYESSSKGTTMPPQHDEINQGYGSQTNAESTNDKESNEQQECTKSGFMGDRNYCKKFYRCVDNGKGGYTKYEFSCGESTVWDPNLEACNHAWAVKDCGGKIPTETSDQEVSTTTTTAKSTQNHYTSSESTTIEEDVDVPYGNQNLAQSVTSPTSSTEASKSTTTKFNTSQSEHLECTSSGFIGDTKDCKKFYRCVDNGKGSYTKFEYKCGEGTVWDPDIDACNHAWAVKKCGGSSYPDYSKEETTTRKQTTVITSVFLIQSTTHAPIQNGDYDTGYGQQQSESPLTTTISTSTASTKRPQNQKPNDGTECKSSGFMGDKNDCKKFYRCVDSGNGAYIRYEFSCGEGTVWDPNIEACNHAWAVDKCGGSEMADIQKETTSRPNPTMSDEEIVTGYITESTENNDQNIQTVKPSSSITSSVVSNENNKCRSSGFIGDKDDCKKFYRCVDDAKGGFTRHEFSCGEGTVWDQSIEACNHAWSVKECGEIGNSFSVTEVETTSQLYSEIITDSENIDQGYGPSSSEKTTTMATESFHESKDDTCNKEGFFGDNLDCKKFYRCVESQRGEFIKYEFACGEGTVWDSEINACNHANSVKRPCSAETSTQSQNPNQTTVDFSTEQVTPITPALSTEKPNLTQKPSSDNECSREGFVGDEYDCKKFHRCVDNGHGGYIKFEFTCGDGTVWDSDIGACNHDSPDKRCGGSGSSTSSIEPEHESDEMFTETSTSILMSSTESKDSITSSQKPQPSSGSCESEGFYGDHNDCKKFYRCVHNGNGGYTKYDFSCGDGTVWDQEIQACNHESSSKNCSKSSVSGTSETQSENSDSTSTISSVTNEQQTTQITEGPPKISTTSCISEGFYANPDDCKKFFRCVSNGNGGYVKYDFSCGEGTVWVQDIQACDHDNDVTSCSSNQSSSVTSKPQAVEEQQSTTEMADSFSSASTQSQKPDKEDDEYVSETSSELPSSGKEKCSSEGFYPNINDCKKFYRCVDNGNGGYTKYEFACGEGTAWDSEIQSCNHINEVKSCQGLSQEENQSKPVMQDEDPTQTTDKTSTTKSSTLGPTSENSRPTNKDTCEHDGYFGNSEDCKKFYRCVDNGKGGFTKYDYTCGEGTIWDQEITTCNHERDVTNPSCTSSMTSSSSSEDSSANSSSSSSTSSTTESNTQSSSDCSQEDSSKKPANQNITCTKAGYYAEPNDCKKFYRCVDWDGDGKRFSVYHFDCGEGTIWDPALDTCNHEESVYPPRDCSGAQSQNENIHQESTTTAETTTQELSSSEQTTTQQATTSEQTTTQETTTSEHTTAQQTTTAETTSSEHTTTQQTTTEETTSSEQTTTQQITTEETTLSEQTTAQQTTTAQTTSSEKTTTEQTSSSEQTTVQQITSELTTTQQTISSEQTTAQQTTTELTTSSDQTTTQQSSNEQSTEQQLTTESTTIQELTTTESSTTQQPTTSEETTTQESTTEQSTTTTEKKEEQTTTDQTTTQQSTTEEQTTPESETTDKSTTSQQTDESSTIDSEGQSTTESGASTTESSSSSNNDCPETEDDQHLFVCPTSFRRHPKYCNMFYQCTEDDDNHEVKIASFNCPNNTIYDETKTQCVEEDKSEKKCDGEIADRRRFKRLGANYKEPIVVNKESLKCPTIGYFPFENFECSSAFLKCQKTKSGKLRGYVYRCPEGYVYWSVSKRCETKQNLRDCKQYYNDWSGRWEFPIERRNVAP